jgi:hypothetical protein
MFVNVDDFRTHNQFYGGEIGIFGEYHFGDFFVDLRGKIGLGETHETVDINGGQRVTLASGAVQVAQGGLLTASSNIGHFAKDRFSWVPEVGLDIGYQVTPNVRVFAGYTFFYWSSVLRPGEQIDTTVDVTLVPFLAPPGTIPTGQARPAVLLRASDFWAQGINAGIEFDF